MYSPIWSDILFPVLHDGLPVRRLYHYIDIGIPETGRIEKFHRYGRTAACHVPVRDGIDFERKGRDCRQADKIDIPVQAAIYDEIRHRRRYHLGILAVVAPYAQRDTATEPCRLPAAEEIPYFVSDVDIPLVIASDMASSLCHIDIDIRLLSGALELEKHPAIKP